MFTKTLSKLSPLNYPPRINYSNVSPGTITSRIQDYTSPVNYFNNCFIKVGKFAFNYNPLYHFWLDFKAAQAQAKFCMFRIFSYHFMISDAEVELKHEPAAPSLEWLSLSSSWIWEIWFYHFQRSFSVEII